MKNLILSLLFITIWSISIFGQNYADIITSYLVCSNNNIEFLNLLGTGKVADNIGLESNIKERNSSWMIIPVEESGDLSFNITPITNNNDLDFILYKIDNINAVEKNKIILRVMLSGRNIKDGDTNDDKCLGKMGLRSSSTDQIENPGCTANDDNFLKHVKVNSGEYYLLWVNNFYPNKGYSINWTGSAKLGMKNHTFSIKQNPETDELTIFDPLSNYSNGIEIDEWDFGFDAIVSKNEKTNSYNVFYKTSGNKTISHRVKLKTGCEYTQTENAFITKPLMSSFLSVISLYPNPTQNIINLVIDSNIKEKVEVKIINNLGEIAHKRTHIFTYGRNELSFNVKNYPAGEYRVSIATTKGILKEKFIKL